MGIPFLCYKTVSVARNFVLPYTGLFSRGLLPHVCLFVESGDKAADFGASEKSSVLVLKRAASSAGLYVSLAQASSTTSMAQTSTQIRRAGMFWISMGMGHMLRAS